MRDACTVQSQLIIENKPTGEKSNFDYSLTNLFNINHLKTIYQLNPQSFHFTF